MFHLYVAPTSSQRVIREKYIVSEKRHRLIILTTIHGIGVDVPFARISQQNRTNREAANSAQRERRRAAVAAKR